MTTKIPIRLALLIGVICFVQVITNLGYHVIDFPARHTLETIAVFAFPGSLYAAAILLSAPDGWPIIIANLAGVAAILTILTARLLSMLPSGRSLVAAYIGISLISALPTLHWLFW